MCAACGQVCPLIFPLSRDRPAYDPSSEQEKGSEVPQVLRIAALAVGTPPPLSPVQVTTLR